MSTRHLPVCIFTIAVALVVLLAFSPGCATATAQVVQDSNSSVLRQRVAQERACFRDLTATLVVESKDDRVLEKIGERRISEYGVKRAQIRLKAPNCTRIESAANGLRAISITNHENSILKVKPIGYQKSKPLSDSARNRPLIMLLGLVTPNLWDQFTVSDAGARGEGSAECCTLDLSRRWVVQALSHHG